MAVEASDNKVLIVGGGFGALAAAVALHKIGVESVVFEKSSHARSEGFSIGVFTNGWRTLDELGVGDRLRAEHLRIKGMRINNPKGQVMGAFNIKDCAPPSYRPEHELRVVMREAIPRHLTEQLPPGTVRYSSNVVDASATATGAEVMLESGQKYRGRFLIIADGVHSQTAAKYHKAKLDFMDYAGWRAITEVDAEECPEPVMNLAQGNNGVRVGFIPARFDAGRKKVLWYWFMAHPSRDTNDYGTPEEQKALMKSMVKGWTVGNFQQLLDATKLDNVKLSKIYQRQVQPGKPWFEGCITGVGDACHATTPFLAQGGSMALESGVELAVFIKKAMQQAGGVPFAQLPPQAICAALREYEIVRSRRVAFIVTKSRNAGRGFRRRNWLVRLLLGLLMKLGLFQTFAINPSTFLDHADWEPSGTLTDTNAAKNGEVPAAEE